MKILTYAAGMAAAISIGFMPLPSQAATPTVESVLKTYADIAEATYGDSLATAKALQGSIDAFLAAPSVGSHQAAKLAWKLARVPYQQSEAFRFGNSIVDEWEGRVNAWPLDEGLIDYVDSGRYGETSDENVYFTAKIIANPSLDLGGRTLKTPEITIDLIRELHELDEIEANVTTGYSPESKVHHIRFGWFGDRIV